MSNHELSILTLNHAVEVLRVFAAMDRLPVDTFTMHLDGGVVVDFYKGGRIDVLLWVDDDDIEPINEEHYVNESEFRKAYELL